MGSGALSLSFQGLSSSAAFAGWLRWETIAPSGASVFNACFGDVGRKTLPETGTYRIRVWVGANNPAYVGVYAFRIFTLPGDVRCAIQKGAVVSDGVPVAGAGRIDQPGGLDTYTFEGLAGQNVNFEQLSAAAAFGGWLYWQGLKPSGTTLFTGYFPGSVRQRRTLPETGIYTIRVYPQPPNTTSVGASSFRTRCAVSAGPDEFATLPNTALTIPRSKFLCNARLEIGDSPTLAMTNPTSAFGGTLVMTSNAISSTPPAGFNGLDHFTYRLRGQFGDEDTANVVVRVGTDVQQGATVVSVVSAGTSSVMVCLLGLPNQTYVVEQSSDLTAWSSAGLLTADGIGSMTYHYEVAPVGKRFYRFRRQ